MDSKVSFVKGDSGQAYCLGLLIPVPVHEDYLHSLGGGTSDSILLQSLPASNEILFTLATVG